MKSLLLTLLVFGFLQAGAQSTDPALTKRLNDYIRLNREMKFKELMEYIHPGIYKFVTREQLAESFEKGYDSEDMKITIDSISVTTISPVFVHNGGSYHKVVYHLGLSFYMKDEEMMKDSTFAEIMTSQLEAMFPAKKVTFSKDKTHFTLIGPDVLVAIKDDEKSEWMFLGYDPKRAEMLEGLFPQEVIDNLGLNK
jgi:hypothetical protein